MGLGVSLGIGLGVGPMGVGWLAGCVVSCFGGRLRWVASGVVVLLGRGVVPTSQNTAYKVPSNS